MTVRAELILHRTSEVRDAPTGEPLVEAHAYGKLIVPDGFYRAVSIREFTQHTADGFTLPFLFSADHVPPPAVTLNGRSPIPSSGWPYAYNQLHSCIPTDCSPRTPHPSAPSPQGTRSPTQELSPCTVSLDTHEFCTLNKPLRTTRQPRENLHRQMIRSPHR